MDISFFREFIVLAETKNYWEAADRLYLNQSTLSKHIKAMEKELGSQLFSRTTRKVELTDAGLALLPYARSISRIQFDYSAKLLQLQNQRKGILTIGSIPAMAQYHITDILMEYRKSNPECHVKVIEDDPKELIRLLHDKDCELVFLREGKHTQEPSILKDDSIGRIPYLEDHLVAILPADHPLASRSELDLRELQEEDFAFIKESSMMYDLCCSACQTAGFVPHIVFDSHRLDSIMDMVTRGGCVALLMNYHVTFPQEKAFPSSAPFSIVRITPDITTRISLCYRKKDPLSSAAMKFIEFFRQLSHTTEGVD
jgi:DNA-binding transcriptional LysR family regulator